MLDHVLPDRIVVRADRWADPRQEVLPPAAESVAHRPNRARDDPSDRPQPSGMHDTEGARARVKKQHGNAVGKSHEQRYRRSVADHRVRFAGRRLAARSGRLDDLGRVNLPDVIQGSRGALHRREGPLSVGDHALALVADRPTDIQGVPRRRAHASLAREDGLDESRPAQQIELIVAQGSGLLERHVGSVPRSPARPTPPRARPAYPAGVAVCVESTRASFGSRAATVSAIDSSKYG